MVSANHACSNCPLTVSRGKGLRLPRHHYALGISRNNPMTFFETKSCHVRTSCVDHVSQSQAVMNTTGIAVTFVLFDSISMCYH